LGLSGRTLSGNWPKLAGGLPFFYGAIAAAAMPLTRADVETDEADCQHKFFYKRKTLRKYAPWRKATLSFLVNYSIVQRTKTIKR
jgi:hypothetical protein